MGKRNVRADLYSLIILVGIILFWEIIVIVFHIPKHILPVPGDVFKKFVELSNNSILQDNIFVTLKEILIGFSFGTVFGLFIGYVLAKSIIIEKILSPYILIFQTAPKISMAPLFVLWFGLGITSKIVLIALVTFFPVMINIILGIRSTKQDYYYLLKILKAKPWQKLLKVEFMNALPYLLTGLRVAMVLSVTAAVIGEMMGARGGLGFLLILGNEMYDITLLLTVIFTISILSFILDLSVRFLQEKLLFWHESMELKEE